MKTPHPLIDWSGYSPFENEGYYTVLEHIDATKDPTPLLQLLNVPDSMRRHFKDLFERLVFRVRAGKGRAIPSYTLSAKQRRIAFAMERFRTLRLRKKLARKEAIARAAGEFNIDPKTLDNSLKKGHGSLRRAGKQGELK
jgi:hypothetical protein